MQNNLADRIWIRLRKREGGMKIKIEDMQLKRIDYRKLKPLQGNLKILTETNYAKLKKSFSEKNLFIPQFVWKDGDEYKLLDGHGRSRFFEKEKPVFKDKNGKDTYEVPCLVVEAKDLKDAKEKLLVITSQFQTITQEGFDEFTFDIDEQWLKNTTNFDALFEFDEKNYNDKNDEIDVEEFTSEMVIKLEYTAEEYHIVKEQLAKISDTPEQAVWKLLGNE